MYDETSWKRYIIVSQNYYFRAKIYETLFFYVSFPCQSKNDIFS